ncbi:MAG: ferredoxin [Clostridiales bacterium]|jgi:ferredoxin|nr:ferredoxin [Eubacteriales bacterium]MDH7565640.1 ferredoxin [Clostridiales bacterium]
MKARVDREKCIGCGLCTNICPEVFELDEEGLARVKVSEIPESSAEAAGEAADSCPAEAISIE